MKITFHRALAEIKSTANRIEKLTFSTVIYVDVYNKATKLSDSGRLYRLYFAVYNLLIIH